MLAHFENDDALDFLAELSELPEDELGNRLGAALVLPAEGYLEMPEACAAIAAAFNDLGEEVVELAPSESVQGDARLAGLALAALGRVNGEASEWRGWSQNRLRRPNR